MRTFNLIALLLFVGALHAQTPKDQWHGHYVPPGSTVPMCMAESNPDNLGFEPCSILRTQFPDNYLRKQTLHIWLPESYKVPGPGKKFYWLTGALVGATVFDEEEAQRLIHQGPVCGPAGCVTYKEGNPFLGQTRAQAYSVMSALILVDYFVCRHQARMEALRAQLGFSPYRTKFWSTASEWQTPIILGIATHVAFGIKQSYHIQ